MEQPTIFYFCLDVWLLVALVVVWKATKKGR